MDTRRAWPLVVGCLLAATGVQSAEVYLSLIHI